MRHAPPPDTPTPVYVTCPHARQSNQRGRIRAQRGSIWAHVGPRAPGPGPGPGPSLSTADLKKTGSWKKTTYRKSENVFVYVF